MMPTWASIAAQCEVFSRQHHEGKAPPETICANCPEAATCSKVECLRFKRMPTRRKAALAKLEASAVIAEPEQQ